MVRRNSTSQIQSRSGPSTSRGEDTRKSLIKAAIQCLGEYGYAGTTMRRVADLAGVTQGPRQYYFPSTTDLFQAVVDKIHADADRSAAQLLKPTAEVRDRAGELMTAAFQNCGSPSHLAMIELKLACRGDEKLRAAIKDKIDAYEARADEDWVRLFGDTGVPREELITLRAIVGATLRGLGVALASGTEPAIRKDVEAMLTDMIGERITAGRGQS